MLVSLSWLQTYFKKTLPTPEDIADAYMNRAFEVEGVAAAGADTVFDLKVLPDRSRYALCHRGMAGELSAILDIPLDGPAATSPANVPVDTAVPALKLSVTDAKACPRYAGRLVLDVTVTPSPSAIADRLSALGQRPINNIVDAANFVMFDIGQPLHAFDADKIVGGITVRFAKKNERIVTLDGKDVALDEETLVIADDEGPVAIAGIKGGARAGVTDATTRLILESASFAPGLVRKTAVRLGIRTDASKRFENAYPEELASEAIERFSTLIRASAPVARFGPVADAYPAPRGTYICGASLNELSGRLGIALSREEVEDIFRRLALPAEYLTAPVARIVETAKRLIGTPYHFGASVRHDAPHRHDCSSLTAYCYSRAGISIPRVSADQFRAGEPIAFADLAPGDLLFAKGDAPHHGDDLPKGGVGHVGVYLGDGIVAHASSVAGKAVAVHIGETPFDEKHEHSRGARRIPGITEPRFAVTVPPLRGDIRGAHDLSEEVGRLHGYEHIPAKLPAPAAPAAPSTPFIAAEHVRDALVAAGFSEIITRTLADKGDIEVAGALCGKSFLRTGLAASMTAALKQNVTNAELLSLDEVRLFELSHVFPKHGEQSVIAIGGALTKKRKGRTHADVVTEGLAAVSAALGIDVSAAKVVALPDNAGAMAEFPFPEVAAAKPFSFDKEASVNKFKAFSPYPFIVRDVAVFVPEGVSADAVWAVIAPKAGGKLLVNHRLFDTFTKEFPDGSKKVSYAFRLVLQSTERTLTDDEANIVAAAVADALKGKGWEVR